VVVVDSLAEHLFCVVDALGERFASQVVLHRLLRWLELDVVGSSAGRVDESPRSALHRQFVGQLEHEGTVQGSVARLQQVVELKSGDIINSLLSLCLSYLLRLLECAWIAVEKESASAVSALEVLGDQCIDLLIRDQFALAHQLLETRAEFASGFDFRSQQVA